MQKYILYTKKEGKEVMEYFEFNVDTQITCIQLESNK